MTVFRNAILSVGVIVAGAVIAATAFAHGPQMNAQGRMMGPMVSGAMGWNCPYAGQMGGQGMMMGPGMMGGQGMMGPGVMMAFWSAISVPS